MLNNRKGFTLIELMVVAIIVAILAVVAIPLMRGNTERAIATECESALGSIRSAMRAYYAEHGNYSLPGVGTSYEAVIQSGSSMVPGFNPRVTGKPGDLDGTYFSEDCYEIQVPTADTFDARCVWGSSDNTSTFTPRAADAAGTDNTTSINEIGEFTRTNY